MDHEFAFIPAMPADRVVELAQLAEDSGYSTLYLPDQTFHRDPFLLLALCARATRRIRLGLSVTNPYTRHPIQIARAAGLLAELSKGRFVLGFGTGNRSRVLAGFGLEQTRPLSRIEEAVQVVRQLLRGETVEHRSPTLTVDRVALDFAVPFEVPIYVASRGPRLLALAGRIADGAIFESLFTTAGVEYARGEVRSGAMAAGRPDGAVRHVAWQAVTIDPDRSAAARPELRRWAALIIHTTQDAVLHAIGLSKSTVEAVRREIERSGPEGAGSSLEPEDVQRLLMVGTPEQVGDRINDLRRTGVDAMAALALGGHDQVRATMTALTSVIAQLRPAVSV